MDSRKLLRTFLLFGIAGIALSGTADSVSQQYADQSLTRALVTFTAARALNAVISVAQGTEVAVEPGGVGVILTPGQVLDPINDLIEQFSGIMLIAATSIGLQIILLEISSWWAVTAVLIGSPVLIAAMAVGFFIGLIQALTQIQDQTISFVPKLITAIVVLSLCMPWLLGKMMEFSEQLFVNAHYVVTGG